MIETVISFFCLVLVLILLGDLLSCEIVLLYVLHDWLECSSLIGSSSSFWQKWKKRAERSREQHCCQIAKIQQICSIVLLSLLAFFISVNKNYYYYLSNCCIPVSHVATRRHLRPAARHQLTVPRHRPSTYGRRTFAVAGPTMFKGPFIATQLNSTQLDVELSTRSQREQLSPISSELRDQVDSVCRSWRHIRRVLTSFPGDEIWSKEFEEKLTELWKNICLFIWHIDQSLQRPCKKAAALENIYQEMNVADWLSHITMQHWEHV